VADKSQRAHLVSIWNLLVKYEPQIHYLQRRPMSTQHLSEAQLRTLLKAGHGLAFDCSEAITLACRLAGLRSPSGPAYPYASGQGNSESMLAYLPHYTTPANAKPGAIVHFGSPDHVGQVLVAGKDPLLGSHGGERGPLKVRLSVERQYHPGPVTFLSIAHL
jgi:hypothetical protein